MKHSNWSAAFVTLLLGISIFVISCARMSAPTGGPKDEDPPMALKSKPVNYATNFSEGRFLVQFDEFIVLKNINQELLVSPPLHEKPKTKLRGKNLIVTINNKLKDSTTYNFNFYNAIVDLNENNLLKNFQFEFSTGPEFDSLYLGGNMTNAFNYKSEASCFIMLYEQFNDTIPRTTIPSYVGKTDENGNFFITNLKNKPYYIFGLKDMNNNMLFDLPNEGIAFSDSTFNPGFKEITLTDTLKLLSFISPDNRDTIYRDSIISYTEMVTTIGDIRLFYFTEDYKNQYYNKTYRAERQQVVFAFNRDVDSNFRAVPIIESTIDKAWYVQEKLKTNDSLLFWIKDSALFNRDSLYFSLSYTMKDSNKNDFVRTDTVVAIFTPKETKENKGKGSDKKASRFNLNIFSSDKEESVVDSVAPPSELTFVTNTKAPFDLNKPIEILARFPIESINAEQIELYHVVNDSVKKNLRFEFSSDSLQLRNYFITSKMEEEEKYELYLPKGTFTDIYSNINDSLRYNFSTRPLDYYSNIQMHVFGVFEPSVIQLMDEKEQVIEERKINGDTTLNYKFLHPKKYIFKLFYDSNQNGTWDTGNFKERKQPEAVFYFPQEIETKSNWDMEYEWELYPVGPPNLKKDKKKSTDKGGQPSFAPVITK